MEDLIELQLDTLSVRDARGRLVPPAARVFLGRSLQGNTWAVRQDLEPDLAEWLARLCEAEPTPTELGPLHPPGCREPALRRLAPITREWRGPAYVLPEELPAAGRAREASAAEVRALLEAFPTWKPDDEAPANEPIAFAFVGDEPAALCHSARATRRAAEAGVETRPEFRGRGLAVEATACWARAIARSGRTPLYSTSWDNAGSRGVARRLGARLYGEDWHLT